MNLAEFGFPHIYFLLPIAFLGYIVWIIVYELCLSPFHKIPGPFLARFTRLWELYDVSRCHVERTYLRLHERYGPVVRVGPNKFSFNHPSDTRLIYAVNSGFNKAEFYAAMGDPHRTSIFNTQDPKDHADRKRKVAGLYTMSTMVNYEPAVDKMTAVCLKKLGEYADGCQLIPMHVFMQYYAFDVVAQITFDQNFGMMTNNSDYGEPGLIKTLHSFFHIGTKIGVMVELLPWFVKIGKIFSRRNPAITMTTFLQSSIDSARNKDNPANTNPKAEPFVNKCLSLERQGELKPEGVMDSCSANINAGSDTTGITLTAILYYLYKYPETLQRLRGEIDVSATKGLISDPVTFQEAQTHLPYLGAVVKEALRLHPAAGVLLPRVVPKGGANLGGYFFPAGTEVGTSAVALHLNRRFHGDDCTQWRPERWLDEKLFEDNPEKKLAMSFAFGGGSRVCLGKNISLLEMMKLVPQIVRRYDLVFERNPVTGNELEAELHTAFFVWLRYNCYVRDRSVWN